MLGDKPTKTLGVWISESESRQTVYFRGLVAMQRLACRWYGCRVDELPPEMRLEFLTRVFERDKEGRRRRGLWGAAMKQGKRLMWVLEGSFEAVELLPILVQDARALFFTSRVSWVWLGYDGPPMPLGYPDPTKPRSDPKNQSTPGLEETARFLERSTGSKTMSSLGKRSSVDVVVIGSGAGGAVVAKELGDVFTTGGGRAALAALRGQRLATLGIRAHAARGGALCPHRMRSFSWGAVARPQEPSGSGSRGTRFVWFADTASHQYAQRER